MLTAIALFIVFFAFIFSIKAVFAREVPLELRLNFVAKVLAIAITIGGCLHFGDRYISEIRENAFQKELRSEIRNIQKFQEIVFKEYGRYAKTLKEIGTLPAQMYPIYLSEEEFPIYLKHNLEKKDWPYATTDDYQFVIEVRRRTGINPEILIQPKNGPLRGLEKK